MSGSYGYKAMKILGSAVGIISVLMLSSAGFAILASAFEAYVVNVTAKIEPAEEPEILECSAKHFLYWKKNEGCLKDGLGASPWAEKVNLLSANFSGVFASHTGEQICQALWVPNCISDNPVEAARCEAKARVLANLLNVASERLHLEALIAGADNGADAFDTIGLSASSTVGEALKVLETVLADSQATEQDLRDARYISKRIFEFYKYENPIAPLCVMDLDQLPSESTEEEGFQASTMLVEEVEVDEDDLLDDSLQDAQTFDMTDEEPFSESETGAEILPQESSVDDVQEENGEAPGDQGEISEEPEESIEEESEQNQEPDIEQNNRAPEEIVQEP